MRLLKLRIERLRNLGAVELSLASTLNVLVGANGAGKSSILEAAFLLSHGHTFRSGPRDILVQRGSDGFVVYGEWQDARERIRRLGAGRHKGQWILRVDGQDVRTVSELVRHCAVTCFEPGSHALISGAADERRRFLDWGTFHVKHEFLPTWRRYQRALRQRNALLRSPGALSDPQFDAWESELATHAATLDGERMTYLQLLEPHLLTLLSRFLPELGAPRVTYRRGWPDEVPLEVLLRHRRERDRARGFTHHGAHRADWGLSLELAPLRDHLSRGQTKLVALACILAQAAVHAQVHQDWPLVCLDDLASELDQAHQEAVIAQLQAQEAQILVTGTSCPELLRSRASRMFHVEQGAVRRLL